VDVPARIEEYQRAEEERRAELAAVGSLAIELVEDGGDEPKKRHEPIPHREQNELFLPGTKPTPRKGFFEKLRFW
jgi:hypothetical protein